MYVAVKFFSLIKKKIISDVPQDVFSGPRVCLSLVPVSGVYNQLQL